MTNQNNQPQYITGPAPDEKMVNLKTVTNIAFETYLDRNDEDTYKIIMNFDYSVSLKQDYQNHIPDYIYFITHDKQEYDDYMEQMSNLINQHGWLAPKVKGNINRIINPDKVSFIATDKRKNRVIFNLATPVTFYNNNTRLTSDFIYVDFPTIEEFHLEYKYLKDQLNTREL